MKFKRQSVWIVPFIALALAFMGFIFPSSASASSEDDPTPSEYSLTERDFGLYCLGKGYQQGVTSVHPDDAYSLRCQNADGSLNGGIDVTDVCKYTYGAEARDEFGKRARLVDRLEDVGNQYEGWGCIVTYKDEPVGKPTEANLQEWCADRDLDLSPNDGRLYEAYGWFCTDHHGYYEGIPMDELCTELFGRRTIDRVANVYDKNSWECWRIPKNHHWRN